MRNILKIRVEKIIEVEAGAETRLVAAGSYEQTFSADESEGTDELVATFKKVVAAVNDLRAP